MVAAISLPSLVAAPLWDLEGWPVGPWQALQSSGKPRYCIRVHTGPLHRQTRSAKRNRWSYSNHTTPAWTQPAQTTSHKDCKHNSQLTSAAGILKSPPCLVLHHHCLKHSPKKPFLTWLSPILSSSAVRDQRIAQKTTKPQTITIFICIAIWLLGYIGASSKHILLLLQEWDTVYLDCLSFPKNFCLNGWI